MIIYNALWFVVFTNFEYVSSGFTTTKLGPNPMWNMTYTDNLRHDLLLNYDKFARPAQHYNVTTVKFDMTINHIEVNELKSTVTVHSWIKLVWTDEKLKWDPEEYGGVQQLHLAEHEIWQPDIFVYNSATSTSISGFANTHCIAYDNGEVLWVPPTQLTVLCKFNFKYWPFDTQMCYMKFGSWTSHGDLIDLEVSSNKTDILADYIFENTEWTLEKTSIEKDVTYYSCCTEPYPAIMVNLTLVRNSPSYKTVIVTPAFVIAVMTLVAFWLPPESGEKITINASTAIIICIFMLYFTQKLPAMGNHTPLIVLFYNSCLYIVAFSLIGSITVVTLSKTKHHKNLPWILKKPLTGTFGKLLGLHAYIQQSTITTSRITAEEMRDHQVTDFDDSNGDEHHIIRSQGSSSKPSLQQDWILLAAAIDRVSFCFYSLLFAILAIVYSV